MVERKSDSRDFIMKETLPESTDRHDYLKAETKLMQIIDSPYVMKAEEIYEYKKRVYIIMEFMDGKEITQIIDDFHA